jgi:hypothetical protein
MYNSEKSHTEVANSILWNNIADEGQEIFNDTSGSAALRYSIYRDIDTNIVTGGGIIDLFCIDTDPLFRDTTEDDYRLSESSPAIDRGDPVTLHEIFPGGPDFPLDLDSNPRIKDHYIDIGAYEFQGFVSTKDDSNPAEFRVFPNPALRTLFISTPDDVSRIEITTVTGQIVYPDRSLRAQDTMIDITNLPSGLYVVTLTSGKMSRVFKCIKQ